MHVDPELERLARNSPDEIVAVVLVCSDGSEATLRRLAAAGLRQATAQADFGLVYGGLRLADLDRLVEVAGIESIELDSEQRVL